jgi:hypothetical protein
MRLTHVLKKVYNRSISAKIKNMMLRKKILLITALVLLLALGAFGYGYFKHAHRFDNVVTTSKAPTAQAGYSQGDDRQSNSNNGVTQGGAVDTGGQNVPTETAGITSTSGAITVKQPAEGEALAVNSVISGVTNGVSTVQYRLIDDKAGVIAEGALKVVSGAFSGSLQFSSHSSSGRLDIFSYDSLGDEKNSVEIPVTFKE